MGGPGSGRRKGSASNLGISRYKNKKTEIGYAKERKRKAFQSAIASKHRISNAINKAQGWGTQKSDQKMRRAAAHAVLKAKRNTQ